MTPDKPFRPVLRRAEPADAPCLGVLATQVFLDTYATEGIRPAIANEALEAFSTSAMAVLLERESTHVRIAEHAGHPIGFAQITIGTGHDLVISASPAELDRVYVQGPFTRIGVGSALLRAAEELASSAGAADLWLTLWIGNQRARRFYEKHAYVHLGATDFHMQGETIENRVLSKRLRRCNCTL